MFYIKYIKFAIHQVIYFFSLLYCLKIKANIYLKSYNIRGHILLDLFFKKKVMFLLFPIISVLWKVKWLAKCHTPSKWHGQEEGPGHLMPNILFLQYKMMFSRGFLNLSLSPQHPFPSIITNILPTKSQCYPEPLLEPLQ